MDATLQRLVSGDEMTPEDLALFQLILDGGSESSSCSLLLRGFAAPLFLSDSIPGAVLSGWPSASFGGDSEPPCHLPLRRRRAGLGGWRARHLLGTSGDDDDVPFEELLARHADGGAVRRVVLDVRAATPVAPHRQPAGAGRDGAGGDGADGRCSGASLPRFSRRLERCTQGTRSLDGA